VGWVAHVFSDIMPADRKNGRGQAMKIKPSAVVAALVAVILGCVVVFGVL
jgi:hypothetical protein